MITYTPKEIEGNVNISSKSPLREFAKLLSSVLLIMVGLYVVLGLMVDMVVPHLPPGLEDKLANLFNAKFADRLVADEAFPEVQKLLDELIPYLPDPSQDYKVLIVADSEANALALPGRTIVVFAGLLKEIDSQNQLAFVLGHELGHFVYKDHLRALGRSLVLLALSTMLSGRDSGVSRFLANSLSNAEMKFSQAQEEAADLFALEVLQRKYGHVAGAASFMEMMQEKEHIPPFFYFFATHPHPERRLAALEKKIEEEGWRREELTPLPASFQAMSAEIVEKEEE